MKEPSTWWEQFIAIMITSANDYFTDNFLLCCLAEYQIHYRSSSQISVQFESTTQLCFETQRSEIYCRDDRQEITRVYSRQRKKKNKPTKKPRNSGQPVDTEKGVLEVPQQENWNKKTACTWCSKCLKHLNNEGSDKMAVRAEPETLLRAKQSNHQPQAAELNFPQIRKLGRLNVKP